MWEMFEWWGKLDQSIVLKPVDHLRAMKIVVEVKRDSTEKGTRAIIRWMRKGNPDKEDVSSVGHHQINCLLY